MGPATGTDFVFKLAPGNPVRNLASGQSTLHMAVPDCWPTFGMGDVFSGCSGPIGAGIAHCSDDGSFGQDGTAVCNPAKIGWQGVTHMEAWRLK